MAYTSTESGERELYVRSFPDTEKTKYKVSTNGGDSPLWSPDGRELFYRKDGEVIRVPIAIKPTFKAGRPETLFRGDFVQSRANDGHTWDISPDGKRFLMMKWGATAEDKTTNRTTPKINVILNWYEELKERVPVE
jgi:hypothetical protein